MIFLVMELRMLFQNQFMKFIVPLKKINFKGTLKLLINKGEKLFQRAWLKNSFNSKHFNDYVRGEIRDGITKRIIASPVVVGTSKDLIV